MSQVQDYRQFLLENSPLSVDTKDKKDSYFGVFLILGYFFGVVFYDFIDFKWTDEFMALLLVIFYASKLLQHQTEHNKPVIITFFVSLFYLLYSFKIHSNVPIAIISDYVSQIKPYIGFFCTLAIMPVLSETAKSILKKCCWIVWFYLLVVGWGGYDVIDYFMGHVSRYATAAIITGIIYLFCSPLNWKTFIKVLILVGVGAFSGRAKFFGFYVVLFLVMFLRLKKYHFQWRIKDIIILSIALILIIGVSWNKIEYYFVEGSSDSDELFARPALYMTCIEIFKDYFPFGCGLASFASNFSAEFYSPIYEEYGLDMVYGLSPDYTDFIADSYYPSLAQFGIVGIFLFFGFFVYVFKQTLKYSKLISESNKVDADEPVASLSVIEDDDEDESSKYDDSYSVILYSGILFFLIESTSDTTFTHNRGFYFLIFMGLSLAQLIRSSRKAEKNSEEVYD